MLLGRVLVLQMVNCIVESRSSVVVIPSPNSRYKIIVIHAYICANVHTLMNVVVHFFFVIPSHI